MKVTVKTAEVKKKEITYPALMQIEDEDLVVLFIGENTGIVLHSVGGWKKGEFSKHFTSAEDTSVWKKFEGTITLENE